MRIGILSIFEIFLPSRTLVLNISIDGLLMVVKWLNWSVNGQNLEIFLPIFHQGIDVPNVFSK